jgi:phosphomannomutase
MPNPEHRVALAALLRCMEDAGIDLGFAHDPDADRLAVVVRERDGSLRPLSGDEVGALLGSFMLEECQDKERALLVSTLVSGSLLEHVALAHGAHFERTPTGFKWIASRARTREREEGLAFLFGYEEAIGYAFGSMADDKDGIAALRLLLELVRRLHAHGRTLLDELDTLALRHGVFVTRQITVPREPTRGASSPPTQADLLEQLRHVPPSEWLGLGSSRIDYRDTPEATDLVVLSAPDGTRLCARPSGTEPKLKLYLHAREAVARGDLAAARVAATARLDELAQRIQTLAAR